MLYLQEIYVISPTCISYIYNWYMLYLHKVYVIFTTGYTLYLQQFYAIFTTVVICYIYNNYMLYLYQLYVIFIIYIISVFLSITLTVYYL